MQSEIRIQAVPASADSWTTMGTTANAPANAKRIRMLRFGLAPDWGTTAGSVRSAPLFRILGSGVQEQNPHEYLGMFAGSSTVTTGGAAQNELGVNYMLDIPISPGGPVEAQVNTVNEAVTAGTSSINLFYDAGATVAKNSMSLARNAAGTTTADAYASIEAATVMPRPSTGSEPKRIREVALGVALDQGTTAVSLRTHPRFRFTGAGLVEQGAHEFVGPIHFSGHIGAAASQGAYQDHGTIVLPAEIPIVAGGAVASEHQFDVEVPTASTVAVGYLLD